MLNWRSKIRIQFNAWTMQAIVMIATGILFLHPSQSVFSESYQTALTPTGFMLYCIALIAGGLLILIRPQWLVLGLSPLLIWLGYHAYQSITQVQYTALPYYAPMFLFPLYLYYVETYPDRMAGWSMSQTPTIKMRWFNFPPMRIEAHQIAGFFHLLMAVVVIAKPDGAGLSILYDAIEMTVGLFTVEAVNAHAIYVGMFLIAGLFLIVPASVYYRILNEISLGLIAKRDHHTRLTLSLWTFPMAFPATFFTWFIIRNRAMPVETPAYALIPFLIVVPLHYIALMRGYDDV